MNDVLLLPEPMAALATVTFHVQKLVNASLLLICGQVKGSYSLNRPLLKEVLERVKLDVELD